MILMGVVGAGKTTVGSLLAQKLGWQFADADDFHSAANVEKIRRGIPLDDSDRAPWLAALHGAIAHWNSSGQSVILACSALKRKYRDELSAGPVRFVYLKGSRELILARLHSRHGHFATDSILDTQFADLEEPQDAITVSAASPPEAIVDEILTRLKPELAYPDAATK
jgi:gluconokinase